MSERVEIHYDPSDEGLVTACRIEWRGAGAKFVTCSDKAQTTCRDCVNTPEYKTNESPPDAATPILDEALHAESVTQ